MVEGFKKNEEQLKHYVAEYKTKLKNQDQVWARQYFGSMDGCIMYPNMALHLAENLKHYYMWYQAWNVETLKNYTLCSPQRYDLLKAHAEEKLEEANKEIDNISRGQVV